MCVCVFGVYVVGGGSDLKKSFLGKELQLASEEIGDW